MNDKIKKYSLWFLYLIIAAYLVKLSLGNGDFKVFLEAGKLISQGENPYNKWLFVSKDYYCLYFYSPLWALILVPFSYLPSFIPNAIWLFLNVWFLYRIWKLLRHHFENLSFTNKQINWILILSLIMSLRFILYNFEMIQMTIFLLWGILESLNLISKKKLIWGTLLLAFVINVKIMPLVILPYLLYRKEFRSFIYCIVFSLVFLLLPTVFVGWSTNNLLLSEWWTVINPSNAEHLVEEGLAGHSITSLIPILFSELSQESISLIGNITRLILIASTLFILKWPPFATSKNTLQRLQELSYIVLLIPLIFPHQQKYAFFLAFPAQVYLAHFIIYNYRFRKEIMSKFRWTFIIILISLSLAFMTLTTDGLIGRELNNLSQYYKTITFGSIFLLIALYLCSPHYFDKSTNQKQHLGM